VAVRSDHHKSSDELRLAGCLEQVNDAAIAAADDRNGATDVDDDGSRLVDHRPRTAVPSADGFRHWNLGSHPCIIDARRHSRREPVPALWPQCEDGCQVWAGSQRGRIRIARS